MGVSDEIIFVMYHGNIAPQRECRNTLCDAFMAIIQTPLLGFIAWKCGSLTVILIS